MRRHRTQRLPLIDRRDRGWTGYRAAWWLVRYMTGRGERRARLLGSALAVVKTLRRGRPVVLTGLIPLTVDVEGYVVPSARRSGRRDRRRAMTTVALVAYNGTRRAVRVIPALGPGWGHGGRAWLRVAALASILRRGGRAATLRDR